MPKRNQPDMAPYSDQSNPNIAGHMEMLKAQGQDPYEGFELAFGYGGDSPQATQLGEKDLSNSEPNTFTTDTYKPKPPFPGRPGAG